MNNERKSYFAGDKFMKAAQELTELRGLEDVIYRIACLANNEGYHETARVLDRLVKLTQNEGYDIK